MPRRAAEKRYVVGFYRHAVRFLNAPHSKLLPSKAIGCAIPGIFIHREFILARKHENEHGS